MSLKFNFFLLISLLVIFYSCINKNSNQNTVFKQLPSSYTAITFKNELVSDKDFNVFAFRNYYNGGGVATGDINNDGLADVFFTANMGSNKLYLNKGHLQFEDISEKAGFIEKLQWSTGVVFVDINNDGWLDIYVCNSSHIKDGISRANQLFINNKNLTFTEKAEAYGLANTGYTTQASFFDYDMDGDLDCFIINNSPIPVNTLNYANKRSLPAQNWDVKDNLRGGGDHLFKNENGYFIEVTQQTGIHGSLISLGLGVTVGDVNNDGYLDIYVSNDFFERDYLYINQKNGMFKDEIENWVQHTSLSSMGADMADINNDGYPDIFTTDMMPDDDYRLKTTSSFDNIDVFNLKEKSGFYYQYQQNTLQLNNKNNQFIEIAHYSGVQASDWSWGGLIFDADNDGLQDIYVCNGIYRDVTDQDFMDFFANDIVQQMVTTGRKEDVNMVIDKMPIHPIANKFYKNGPNLQFIDMAKQWGLAQPSHSNGASYADLDNDGDLDLIVNNVNAEAFVYENNTTKFTKNHYLGITLQGDSINTFSIGSKIQAYMGKSVLSREIIPSKGFQSSIDYHQVFGLGTSSSIDSLIIRWPDLTYSTYFGLKADSNYIFKKSGKVNKLNLAITKLSPTLLQNIPSPFLQHKEDDYIDFYYERNLPQLLSREGPRAAIADVNGDKLDDIYIGGAAKQAGQLYLQNAQGKFLQSKQAIFEGFAEFEDVAVLFFDCDNDGDVDLFIGSGGNNVQTDLRNLQHRLYKNDGKGNFTIDATAFPTNKMNISTVVENDINNDGFIDLFVGSRGISGNYGVNPSHYLYINDGKGHFTNLQIAEKGFVNTGNVTSAIWADVVGDVDKELIIVGNYMYPKIYAITANAITEVKTNLNNKLGWWQSVAVCDVNNDGKQDIILGNIGENFYLQPTKENPVILWQNDFDKDGKQDNILTKTVMQRNIPVFLKKELVDQFPILKKQNLRNTDYATKSIEELFSAEIINKSQKKQFNYTSSCVAINNGNSNFTIQKLPTQIQYSSLNAICCVDINNDGKMDIITGGNLKVFPPQFCSLDASYGNILLNDGTGNFKVIESNKNGFNWYGDVKDIKAIQLKNNKGIIVLQNNQIPLLYNIKNRK